MRELALLAWSGGKDSALALHEILKQGNYVITLLTTITDGYGRISMHGVREELLEAQADSLNLPLEKVRIPINCSNGEYEFRMENVLKKYISRGCKSMIFGDIFLEEVRKYRERNLAEVDINGIFPLWKRDCTEISQNFIQEGFKAITTCIDSQALEKSFVGRIYDEQFLKELPSGVDPCGENGEFHTFVFDGPLFHKSIRYRKGEIVLRDNRFYFCDLLFQ